ncbi:hypothetical protein PVT71_12355 [Salipiger sp. H15]|uniref:Uncharacterized protein n=1 Tax=Alloyangia sp. H15 TaxID=3029062 RepID=A0AAU8AFF1_9RHOB
MPISGNLHEAGPDVTRWIRTERGQAALDYAAEVRRDEHAEGEIFIQAKGGAPKRRSSLQGINPEFLPFPADFSILMGEATAQDALDAVRYAWSTLMLSAPRSGSNRKSHSFFYARSFELRVNGRRVRSPDALEPGPRDTVYEIVNVAPHAPALEKLPAYRDRLFHATARRTLEQFGPTVAVASDYISSDQRGYSYGRGTGGPARKTAIYALPRILIGLAGDSGIASRIGRPSDRKRRRR